MAFVFYRWIVFKMSVKFYLLFIWDIQVFDCQESNYYFQIFRVKAFELISITFFLWPHFMQFVLWFSGAVVNSVLNLRFPYSMNK